MKKLQINSYQVHTWKNTKNSNSAKCLLNLIDSAFLNKRALHIVFAFLLFNFGFSSRSFAQSWTNFYPETAVADQGGIHDILETTMLAFENNNGTTLTDGSMLLFRSVDVAYDGNSPALLIQLLNEQGVIINSPTQYYNLENFHLDQPIPTCAAYNPNTETYIVAGYYRDQNYIGPQPGTLPIPNNNWFNTMWYITLDKDLAVLSTKHLKHGVFPPATTIPPQHGRNMFITDVCASSNSSYDFAFVGKLHESLTLDAFDAISYPAGGSTFLLEINSQNPNQYDFFKFAYIATGNTAANVRTLPTSITEINSATNGGYFITGTIYNPTNPGNAPLLYLRTGYNMSSNPSNYSGYCLNSPLSDIRVIPQNAYYDNLSSDILISGKISGGTTHESFFFDRIPNLATAAPSAPLSPISSTWTPASTPGLPVMSMLSTTAPLVFSSDGYLSTEGIFKNTSSGVTNSMHIAARLRRGGLEHNGSQNNNTPILFDLDYTPGSFNSVNWNGSNLKTILFHPRNDGNSSGTHDHKEIGLSNHLLSSNHSILLNSSGGGNDHIVQYGISTDWYAGSTNDQAILIKTDNLQEFCYQVKDEWVMESIEMNQLAVTQFNGGGCNEIELDGINIFVIPDSSRKDDYCHYTVYSKNYGKGIIRIYSRKNGVKKLLSSREYRIKRGRDIIPRVVQKYGGDVKKSELILQRAILCNEEDVCFDVGYRITEFKVKIHLKSEGQTLSRSFTSNKFNDELRAMIKRMNVGDTIKFYDMNCKTKRNDILKVTREVKFVISE